MGSNPLLSRPFFMNHSFGSIAGAKRDNGMVQPTWNFACAVILLMRMVGLSKSSFIIRMNMELVS